MIKKKIKKPMKEFTIYTSWTMVGTMIVEAKNIDEAFKIANDNPELSGDYLQSSFEVNEDASRDNYEAMKLHDNVYEK
jgi:hypothetical protein